MIARQISAVFAALCLLLTAPAAWALEPAGDWVGTLHMPKRDYQVGLRVRHDATGDHVTYDWLDLDIRDVRLDRVGGPDMVFRRTAPQGTFTARWDAERGWTGEWLRKDHPYPVTFHPGALPPAPLISRADRIAFPILGLVILAEAVAIARLLQLRRRRRQRQRVA
jgi:hypothetical protein